ncbi:MAG: DNA topoisomerase IV subunit B, partial [Oscillospiraceae bacterium]|nr:DNA topoisomerase IV subunit B [Oscillospiraceae bacterium]
MYIGSTSVSGLHHLVYEIVDNAIDEALAGYCTRILVTIEPGNIICVDDNGRGVPTEKHHQTGTSTVEVVYTMLHAGGKFGSGGYKVSGGLHGVGASVVNALSKWLEVYVHNGKSIQYMRFEGGKKTGELATIGATDRTGTIVRFLPDDTIFDTIDFDYNTLLTRLREQAFLNAGLSITLEDKREGCEAKNVLCYEGGIRQFVERMNRAKTVLHPNVIYIRGDRNDSSAEIALQYNDGFDSNIYSFANDIRTTEGGMHETGFKTALTKVINEYARKFKL